MKRFAFLLTLVALFAMAACSPTAESGKEVFVILQLNDVYEIGPLENGTRGGMARVETIRKNVLDTNQNLITILSGDFVSPSLIGTLKYKGEKIAGKQMVEAMNAIGVDYVVPGNHEFDISEAELLSRIAESEFQWTTTNCFRIVDGDSVPFEQNGKPFPDHVMHNVNGVNVAFFGPTIPSTQKDYVGYYPVFESTKQVYERIKDQADILIGLTHLEKYEDEELATDHIPQLDLIVGGHDHDNMKFTFGNTIMTKADANAKTVYLHTLSFDRATGQTSIKSDLIAVDTTIKPDPEVHALVERWDNLMDSILTNDGYDVDEQVLDAKTSLDGRESSIRNKPTNYPIIMAKSFLFSVPDADIGIFNSGSLRLDDQLSGTVTQFDVLRSFPFGGGVSIVDLKGDVVKRILDTGTSEASKGTGGYLQLANAENTADGWLIEGKKLSASATYKVVLPDYVMEGRETNLGFVGDYQSGATAPNTLNGTKNDVRDLIIAYMKDIKVYQE